MGAGKRKFLALAFVAFLVLPVILSQRTFADEELPAAALGNREATLSFETNSRIIPLGEIVDLQFSLIDKNQNKNILHTTYVVEILNSDGKKVFTEVVHGHEGKVDLKFRPQDLEQYKIRANYDNYAASYISDPNNPIIIDGPVFSEQGRYNAIIEVAGVDFDNLNLDKAIRFEYGISVFPKQTFSVDYQNQKFILDILSPVTISAVEFRPENKQLVLMSNNNTSGTSLTGATDDSSNFAVMVDVPKEMMSGPFTASFSGNGRELTVEEASAPSGDSKITRLILMQGTETARQGGSSDNANPQQPAGGPGSNGIVITATNVIPEFPAGVVIAAAGVIGAVIAASRLVRRQK